MSDTPQPMSPEEIDALFARLREQEKDLDEAQAQADGTSDTAAEESVAEPDAAPPESTGEPDTTPREAPTTERQADAAGETPQETPTVEGTVAGNGEVQTESTEAVPLPQDDIDDLLQEMGVTATDGEAAGTSEDGGKGAGTDRADRKTGTVDQDDIDALLAEMGLDEGRQVPDDAATTAPESEQLSQEEVERLVGKHTGADESSTESAITQDDIDDLVAQMSSAKGVPDQGHITEMLKHRESDIDALLQDVEGGVDATDAVSTSGSLGGPHGTTVDGTPLVPLGTVSHEEFRGTRYLLVAAVCLLAMCAVTLGFIVSAVNGLTTELAERRQGEDRTTDNFAKDLEVARDYLASEHRDERQRGVVFLEKTMLPAYPQHTDEIVLLLAAHHRRQGYHEEATDYYEELLRSREQLGDPNVYLDHGRSLMAVGRLARAREVLLHLLANADYYTDPELYGGDLDEEERTRHRLVLRRASLLLGRLNLIRGGEEGLVSRPDDVGGAVP